MKFNKFKIQKNNYRGFILPMTLLICSIILAVATGISVILTKELFFSKVSRESQLAYYAADNALMCAIMVDDQYIDTSTGLGIFPYNTLVTPDMVIAKVNIERQGRNLPSITLSDIKCATAPIFDTVVSSFSSISEMRVIGSGAPEPVQKSIFSMRMNLGDGSFRCATVLIYKTETYRQIISRGFSSCGGGNSHPIERAIINTTETE